MDLHRLGFAAADLFGDVVVAGFAQAVFGAEVVDDQRGAHPRGFGDGPQTHTEAVLPELLDGRIADSSSRRQIG